MTTSRQERTQGGSGGLGVPGRHGGHGRGRRPGQREGLRRTHRPLRARTPAQTLALQGRDWHSFCEARPAGVQPVRGDRRLASGDLHAPTGEKVGEFHAALFSLASPGHVGPRGTGSLELHTFNLAEGSIMGTGTASFDPDGPDTFAIVGGTGRYLGIRGAYTAWQRPRELGGDGTAELTLTFRTEEA